MIALNNSRITIPSAPPPFTLLQPISPPQSFLSLSFSFIPPLRLRSPLISLTRSSAAAKEQAEVEMVRGCDGVWGPREQTVVILWDLDNKPPRGPPYSAALSLRRLASFFGRVVEVSAYANRHAFLHLPQWVLDQRRQRRDLDILERKGISVPSEPYVCGVCGRKCRTNLDLKKHFRQLHQREREKKLARMRSLKGKKRQKYRERFVSNNRKYEEAARELIKPRMGYGLASELKRAGVYVRTVADKPQAADAALKRQMQHSMARGIDWMLLVSDDSDFTEMVRRAREAELRTVVVGDGRTALGQHADIWVPWIEVENGEVGEEVLMSARNVGVDSGMLDRNFEDELLSTSSFIEDWHIGRLANVVDQIVVKSLRNNSSRISAFSEEESLDVGEHMGADSFSDDELSSVSEEAEGFYI